MRRLLLALLLVSAAVSAQDKTPYKFMFGGNSYYGSRNATVQWLAARYDAGVAGVGDWPGMYDSIYHAAQGMGKEFWCGPYASSQEINLYERFDNTLSYNQRLANVANHWLYVYAKHYLDSIGVSPESLVVHVSDDYLNMTNNGDGSRSYSLTGLPYHKKRFSYQYWNNTASDTMFYPAGYCWLANGYNRDARDAIAYAFRRHMIDDSASSGPGDHHWTAFFMDNQYREGYAPRLYSYYSVSGTSGGPTVGLDWYEQAGIGNDIASNTHYYDYSTMLIDSTIAAVLDSVCAARDLARIRPFANVDKFSASALSVQLRYTNVSLENPVDYLKAWPNGWLQWYEMADRMAAHPERYINWLFSGDFLCSSNPADWKYDSSRIYMTHYAFFLQVRDTNAFISPCRFNDTTRWRGIYEVDFGEPDGPAYEISSVGTSYSKIAVMRRDYNNSNVVVLVRTSSGQADWVRDSVAVNLHRLYYNIDADGKASSTSDSVFYMKPYMGRILRVAEPCSAPPGVPVWNSPAPGSSVGTIPTLCVRNSNHGNCPDAVSYQFQIADDVSFTHLVRQSGWINEGLSTTCYSAGTPLSQGLRYYWRCRATNGTTTSRWSDAYDFTTPNSPPPTPTASSPANQADVLTQQPILVVNSVSDPNGTPVVYNFQVSKSSAFSPVAAQSGNVSAGPGTTSWQVNTVLDYNTAYYWRARAYDGIAYSGWMTTSAFTVAASDSNVYAMGDLNVNRVANEVADAVMFTNFFIRGLDAFGSHVDESTLASDVNLDGATLSIADLVYQVHIITGGLSSPNLKPIPPGAVASVSLEIKDNAAIIQSDSPLGIGGAYFVFRVTGYDIGQPTPLDGAPGMDIKYGLDENEVKILVYSMNSGSEIPAGVEDIFTLPLHGQGTIELTEVQLSDYYGNMLPAIIAEPLPVSYTLNQNYPNPFNATTVISYDLPSESRVKIDIFNILGERVAALLNERQPAGAHRIIWDGSGDDGKTVASGIYIYRMIADNARIEKKMILMK